MQVTLRNMETGDLTVFRCQDWISKTLGDKKLMKELPAIVKGKAQVKGRRKEIFCLLLLEVKTYID